MTPNQPQSQFGSTTNDMREFTTEQAEDGKSGVSRAEAGTIGAPVVKQ
jgi:hypothetical protein